MEAAPGAARETTRNSERHAAARARADAAERYRDQSARGSSVSPAGVGAAALRLGAGLLAIGVAVWLVAITSQLYLVHTALGSLDPAIARCVEVLRAHWLVHAMWRITLLGSPSFTLAVVVVGGVAMRMRTRSWRALTLLALAYTGAIILEIALKLTVARLRPPAAWMAVMVSGVSFPSGHAARAAALYGMLACIIAELHGNWRRVLWVAAAGLALLVGISRVYLDVHWATDVIGGWVVGAAWLWVVILGTAPRA